MTRKAPKTRAHKRGSPSRSKSRSKSRPASRSAGRSKKYWSGEVTRRSDALDLKQGIFRQSSPRRIALSLKRSAERSRRRKAGPYQSAMSMLTFYLNRGGRNLPARQKAILAKAKLELRKLYGRD